MEKLRFSEVIYLKSDHPAPMFQDWIRMWLCLSPAPSSPKTEGVTVPDDSHKLWKTSPLFFSLGQISFKPVPAL